MATAAVAAAKGTAHDVGGGGSGGASGGYGNSDDSNGRPDRPAVAALRGATWRSCEHEGGMGVSGCHVLAPTPRSWSYTATITARNALDVASP